MATLIVHNPTKEQLQHISKAEKALARAGITFDVGSAMDGNGNSLTREWELDWSLKGAEIRESTER